MSSFVKKKCNECHEFFPADVSVCPNDGAPLATVLSGSPKGLQLGGRYRILEELGRGGMGVIYKAHDNNKNIPVAIKFLLHDCGENDIMRNRFMVEARAASALNHPNVITVYDYNVSEEGLPYMVLEYLDGCSLADLLENDETLTIDLILWFIIDVCDALAHAHRRNVIHRDLKPSNIMIVNDDDGNEKAVLVDFGIAKIFAQPGQTSMRLTQTGEVFGSPLYMSPEQCMGQKLDARSDIYSMGCVLYQCLTGETPFQGENFLNVIFQHVNDAPPSFARRSNERLLESIVFKALAKQPEERYQTMTELRQHLEFCLNKLVQSAEDKSASEDDEDDDDEELGDLDAIDDDELGNDEFAYYEALARDGDANAQLELSLFYRDGVLVEQDEELAFEWCEKSAQADFLEAQSVLAEMYRDGIGVAEDHKEAVKWYRKAAEREHPDAQAALGHMYEYGMGTPVDYAMAVELYTRAAENENIWAQVRIAEVYWFGDLAEQDLAEAIRWYTRAAQQGDANAQLQLALSYRFGEGVVESHEDAVSWFNIAAEQGLPEAQRWLALCHEEGLGVRVDPRSAVRWMTEAAGNGDAKAIFYLGFWHSLGVNGLPRDPKQAIRYFREAAELDDADAKYFLGKHYLTGDGVARNPKTAFHWFKNAAKGGEARAKHEMAICYRDGIGVEASEPSFIKWAEEAANDEIVDAQYDLGEYYRKINKKSFAIEWLTRAASNGHKKAQKSLTALGAAGDSTDPGSKRDVKMRGMRFDIGGGGDGATRPRRKVDGKDIDANTKLRKGGDQEEQSTSEGDDEPTIRTTGESDGDESTTLRSRRQAQMRRQRSTRPRRDGVEKDEKKDIKNHDKNEANDQESDDEDA